MSAGNGSEYPEEFVAGLEWMWGEGWLSPGGPVEVAAILEGRSIRGQRVLDVGCGLGGVDVELVLTHGAAEVVGIDIEPRLLARARTLVARHGLEERISLHHVQPGPFEQPELSRSHPQP